MTLVNEVINGFIAPEQGIIIFKILLSAILGFGIGWNRRSNEAGIRTFTLITLGATIFTIISIMGFPENAETADQSRVVAQIVTGIGFIGVGVIWKTKNHLKGLTTAATIWVAAGVGIAVGVGMFTLAVLGQVLVIMILHLKRFLVKYEDKD
jgi:putative Mg2+ transporter-C (MgtC) family protein